MKKMIFIFLPLVLLLMTQKGFTQSIEDYYNTPIPNSNFKPDMIYLDIKGDNYRYFLNGKLLNTGLFYKKIGKEFKDYPTALAEYRKCRKSSLKSYWANMFGESGNDILQEKLTELNPVNTANVVNYLGKAHELCESKAEYYLYRAVLLRNEAVEKEKIFKRISK